MRRFVPFGFLAALAIASIVLAQSPSPGQAPVPGSGQPFGQATLRTSTGDKPVATSRQNGQTYFAADDILVALGGSVTKDANGFKATYNGVVAAFAPDSRFGVVRDDLIEMPAAPVTLEGKPFVPLQFFQGFLAKAAGLEVTWDPTARLLQVRAAQANVVGVQVSVANVQGISKVVLSLTGAADYGIVKEPGAYTIVFRSPIHAPFSDQSFDDPLVSKALFTGSSLRLQLTGPDIAGDAYKLENPPRIVIDFHKGAAAVPGTTTPAAGIGKPVDVPGIHTIVIDPGHGGKDVGATGPAGMMEKDATLAVCRKLATSLEKKLGARVVLTREDDSVVSLDQRTAIANQYKADLFLSVHMNAAVVKGAHGSETYFLSLDASDELAKKAAETENASQKTPAQPANASDLKLILWDLAQQEYVKESSRFATDIQEEMNAASGVRNRGVKQAPFKVLVGATMPAALVEVAFISNPEEEARLQKDDFQNQVVDALTHAVQRYKTDYETRIGVSAPAGPVAPAGTSTAAPSGKPAATATATTPGPVAAPTPKRTGT